jgi:ribosomal protein S11
MPVVAHADMSECVNITDQNKKNYCMASYSGSAGFCDKIKSYEYRTQCMRMVIAKQRQSAYQVPKPPKKEETK